MAPQGGSSSGWAGPGERRGRLGKEKSQREGEDGRGRRLGRTVNGRPGLTGHSCKTRSRRYHGTPPLASGKGVGYRWGGLYELPPSSLRRATGRSNCDLPRRSTCPPTHLLPQAQCSLTHRGRGARGPGRPQHAASSCPRSFENRNRPVKARVSVKLLGWTSVKEALGSSGERRGTTVSPNPEHQEPSLSCGHHWRPPSVAPTAYTGTFSEAHLADS